MMRKNIERLEKGRVRERKGEVRGGAGEDGRKKERKGQKGRGKGEKVVKWKDVKCVLAVTLTIALSSMLFSFFYFLTSYGSTVILSLSLSSTFVLLLPLS